MNILFRSDYNESCLVEANLKSLEKILKSNNDDYDVID